MKEKLVSIEEAISHIKDGMTVHVGGFLACGTPEKIIDAIIAKGIKDLTIICNDSGFIDKGVGKLVVNNRVKKVIASHIGTNPETGRKMQNGEMEVELVPQGTLAERIRAAGFGLGGAMDLVVGAKKVIVAMEHTSKGAVKILQKCTLPLTAVKVVKMIITEKGVFEITDNGLVLTEISPYSNLEDIKANTGADFAVAEKIKTA